MEQSLAIVVLLVSIFALLAGGIWIALSLMIVGVISMALFTDAPVFPLLATTLWGQSSEWSLTALPLFIWMGEILFRTRLSEDMFSGIAPWVRSLPGRLLHVNVVGSGIFAAVSGSSTATCVTIGRMTIPELLRRGYDDKVVLGSLAGAGTLGIMIPPSIMMIVYGVAADVSIARLFIAGVIPGILLVLLFMLAIMITAWLRPDSIPPADPPTTLMQKLYASRRLIPIVLLIIFVIGSIYGGFATATEAAVIGVIGALILSAVTGTLTWKNFSEALMRATETSCMLAFILAGAAFTSVAMGFTGIPKQLAALITDWQLSAGTLIIVLTILYIILGCFLDGVSMIVLTLSVVTPMIEAAGIDPLWFGIYIVIVVEIATITPPVGFNLFVLQGLAKRDIMYIARGAVPSFLALVLACALLWFFPGLATWLPSVMFRN
jgi:tripartite ATP-independent transporter DctM subunit